MNRDHHQRHPIWLAESFHSATLQRDFYNNDFPQISPKLNELATAMTLLAARVAYTRWLPQYAPRSRVSVLRMHHSPKSYHTSLSLSQPQNNTKNEQKHGEKNHNPDSDPRINNLGRAIEDDFATIRENYGNCEHYS